MQMKRCLELVSIAVARIRGRVRSFLGDIQEMFCTLHVWLQLGKWQMMEGLWGWGKSRLQSTIVASWFFCIYCFIVLLFYLARLINLQYKLVAHRHIEIFPYFEALLFRKFNYVIYFIHRQNQMNKGSTN